MPNQIVKQIYFRIDDNYVVYYETIITSGGYKESQAHVIPIEDIDDSDLVIDARNIKQESKD